MLIAALVAAAALQNAPPKAPPAPSAPPPTAPDTSPATPPATKPPTKAPPGKPPVNSPPATPATSPVSPPTSPTSPTQPQPGGPTTPGLGPTISGRPPENGSPLRRYEPRLWEMKLEANIYLAPVTKYDTTPLQLKAVTVWVPIIVQSTWSQTDPNSVKSELFVQGQPVRNVSDRLTWRHQLPYGMAAVGLNVGDVSGQSLRWNMSWREQVWNTELNDAAAARIPWPQEWPAEVQSALLPQGLVESNAPEFQQFVQKVSGGQLRSVTPFVAAKQLIKATIASFNTLDNTGLRMENGFTRGLVVNGAYNAMKTGNGTIHDMVAACVAVLRAAGIPARPVIGVSDVITSTSNSTKTRLITWAEFYLPGTGWIPFDPLKLRGSGNGLPSPDKPWPNFGSWDDLNERVPLSYTWAAPVPGSSSLPYPAVWSWSASGFIAGNGITQDMIGVQMVNRGRVPE